MPSQLPRTQVLQQPEQHAQMLTLAGLCNRTHSNMAAILIEEAMKLPKWQALLAEAEPVYVVAPLDDPREGGRPNRQHRQPSSKAETITKEDMKELRKMLDMIEALKA